jgi:hypothetical protein
MVGVAARTTEVAGATVGEVVVSAVALTAAVVVGGERSERVMVMNSMVDDITPFSGPSRGL